MTWQPELDELRRREELARQMGGPERVARQHAAGKLTVRERVERLLDAGSFHETGALAGKGEYDGEGELTGFLPANAVVGQGRIDGRRAVVQADDFTVRGGAADAAIWEKMVWAERAAHELRVPLVRLVDGTGGGGSVKTLETMGFSYVPPLPGFDLVVENLSRVPVVAAALGPCAGLGAARVVLSHFSVIVRGSAQLFVAGPPVVAAAMGESPDKEALGGARAQTRAGAVDNEAADEDDALDQLRRFLGYLPGSAWEAPPIAACSDPVTRREEELLAIVPRERRQTYRMRRVLELVLDAGSLFELGARYGRSVVTGAGAPRRAPGRRPGLRPAPLRRRPDRRRVGQARALRRRLRRLPPAGRQLRRPAGLRHRHRGRAGGDDAPRRAGAGRRAPGAHAVVLGARAQGLRRRRRGPRRRLAAEPALRVAQRRLGLAAHRRRHRGGLPARARGRRRSRWRCAPRSRRA